MPTSEPMSPGEIARTLRSMDNKLDRLDDKMDIRPTWTDLDRVLRDRDEKRTDMEKHWREQLQAVRTEVDELQDAQRKVGWSVVGAVLVALVSLVVGAPPVL